jgi:hypothetical protein
MISKHLVCLVFGKAGLGSSKKSRGSRNLVACSLGQQGSLSSEEMLVAVTFRISALQQKEKWLPCSRLPSRKHGTRTARTAHVTMG